MCWWLHGFTYTSHAHDAAGPTLQASGTSGEVTIEAEVKQKAPAFPFKLFLGYVGGVVAVRQYVGELETALNMRRSKTQGRHMGKIAIAVVMVTTLA